MDYPPGATPLEAEEREGLRFPHIRTRRELDQLEQVNIQEGLRWLDRNHRDAVLTTEFVRELHRRLFGEVWSWAGRFRTTLKNIGVNVDQIQPQLRNLLDDTAVWREHSTYPPREAALRFHHRLVFIHPFPNGNGRDARIMADVVLKRVFGQRYGIPWGGHPAAPEAIRKRYLAALLAADNHDYGPLLALYGHDIH